MLTPFIQLYGSGHVHGLQHNGNALLDFERDALHRETGRTLQGSGDHTLTIRRRWDALGRLQALASQGLQRHITHTVYEPETFTPLVQLSAKASAQARPHALMLAVHGDGGDDEGSAQMAQMLQALPGDMRHLLDRSIRQAAREGLPEHILALMPDQGESALRSARNMRKQLEKQEQSQRTEITVRHYHCDHLGTPIALTDEKQNIVWAARLDPWGNVQEEFNPDNIEQSIRLPGQHQDKDTGLYYNRHRYYDPSVGSYVNQDPIGLAGGVNGYVYPVNPQANYDPWGLQKVSVQARRTGTRQSAIFDSKVPDAELSKATANSISTSKDQAGFWDNFKDFINPNNEQKKRINDSLMCVAQENKNTGAKIDYEGYLRGEPSITPLGKPFPPSPDKLDPGWECTKVRMRPRFEGGPPPGL